MIIKALRFNSTLHYKIFILGCILPLTIAYGQEKSFPNELLQLDYSVLKDSISLYRDDSIRFNNFANAFFLKARKDNDTNQLATGYYYRIIAPNAYKRHDLYDSIIELTSSTRQKLNYPTIAFYDKAVIDLESYKYSNALSNLVNAVKYNKGSNKEYLQFIIDINIADIKLRIGNNEEGLNLLKKSFKYAIEENFEKENFERYSYCLFNLANAYRKMNHIDSASTYARIGMNKTKNKSPIFNYFSLLQSILDLEYKYDDKVLNEFRKSIKYFDSLSLRVNSSLGYYYLGKAHLRNNKYEKAIVSFAKVDSLHMENPLIVLPETVDTYKYLIAHYRSKEDYKNELAFLNKYVNYDSILDVNYAFINNNLKRDYDLPLIVQNKETIIKKLDAQNKVFNYGIIVSILLVLLSFSTVIWQITLRKKEKRKIKELLENKSDENTGKLPSLNKKIEDNFNFSEELIERIQKGLKDFENNKSYLKKEINAKVVAQSIGTNTSYFTKIFYNLYKTKFNTYLINIRLEYALDKLKNDNLFRKYTIRSIAQESGFGSSESFSKHFKRRYGVYPSSFIKALENN